MTNGNLEGGGSDLAQQSQDNQGRSKAELLSGMSVRVIDGEPAPPRMVRAAVGVMAPDEVGLWYDSNRILREHGAEPYSGYGTRLDDVAAIHLTIIVPKLEVQSLINKVQELRADHMPAESSGPAAGPGNQNRSGSTGALPALPSPSCLLSPSVWA